MEQRAKSFASAVEQLRAAKASRNHSVRFRARSHQQSGYALVLVVFLTTLLLISVMAIAPSIRTEKQREKEQEMIWRGKQYVRGIKLYYRKMGRFPTSLDDLTKPKIGSIRFMRKAYKDPMNATDGTWRLIYVGPAGNLIGSLKPQQTFQMPGVAGATPASAVGQQALGSGQSGFGAAGQSGFGGSGFGQSGQQGASQLGQNAQPGSAQTATLAGPGGASAGQGNNAANADDGAAVPASGSFNDSPIMGGNIIGVGSKINKKSVMVYDKAKNYRLFEFIWNPSKDMMNALGVQGGGAVQPGAPGQPQQGQGTGLSPTMAPTGTTPPANQPGTPTPVQPPQPQQ